MLLRLALLMLLALSATAGDFFASWPAGKAEKLSYEMTIFVPSEMKTATSVEITKMAKPDSVFIIKQSFDIPSQQVEIKSTEKYRISDMRFISSDNMFKFPPEAKAQLGTDTILIKAQAVGDSIDITSNSPLAPSGRVPSYADLTTSIGAILTSRNYDFKSGNLRKYHQIDFLNFTGQPFSVDAKTDSVAEEESITVPAGTFNCYKTMRSMGEQVGYTYYAKEKNNLPVMLEVSNSATKTPLTRIVLTKVE